MNNNNVKMGINEFLALNDAINSEEKHGLHGHVRISLKDNTTGKVSLWEESDNIIPISGYNWLLLKMFGLQLDSIHDPSNKGYEKLDKDTSVAIPDLNDINEMGIGYDPNAYSIMAEPISADHFIQGFMVGTGGAGEDANTTKNTDYSFKCLRNPIPFQETNLPSLAPSIANKYLGAVRKVESTADGQTRASSGYFIKKFDETPHVYHSWYRNGQNWDYVDPVTQNDLGPMAANTAKTNRIETYAQCRLSIEGSDCLAAFKHQTSSSTTPKINELGLVSFNTIRGIRSTLESIEKTLIQPMLRLLYDKKNVANPTIGINEKIISYANSIKSVLSDLGTTEFGEHTSIDAYGNQRMNAFYASITRLSVETSDTLDYAKYMGVGEFGGEMNLNVKAYYNQNNELQYTTDEYLDILGSDSFNTLSTDEAERIKLFTYYTFTGIPLEENISILIDYRIYAN